MIGQARSGASRPSHYAVLDIMRGLAAFSVVAFHVLGGVGVQSLFGKAYLAVDFFFLLSGFVIAKAYDGRLAGSMTFKSFADKRVRRLYPLLLLGMLLGILVSLAKIFFSHAPVDATGFILSALFAVTMLPFGHLAGSAFTFLYPFNTPAWSLFFELIANAVYGIFRRLLSNLTLCLIIAISATGLIVALVLYPSLDVGSSRDSWWGGFARVGFSFFLGILLFRKAHSLLFKLNGAYSGTASSIALLLILGGLPLDASRWVDLLCVVALFPLILLVGASADPSTVSKRAGDWLGGISYPIYLVHVPIARVFVFIAEKLHLTGPKLAGLLAIDFIIILVAGYAAWKFFDEPVQRWLKR